MAETMRERMVRGYAFAIFVDGTRTFTGTGATYHADIKAYAAVHFTDEAIQGALTKGWITQAEHDETLALKPAPVEPAADPAPTEPTPTA
jgi:hypothetical protein